MKPFRSARATLNRARSGAPRLEESQVQDSERALVPLGPGLAGPPPVAGGRIDLPLLLAAAMFGLAV
ncbi:MAG: hypothetical protein M3O65_15290, partial [Actinomycetota bacterium]|nr:hypothetical protein [Actinomycetota bacterium]